MNSLELNEILKNLEKAHLPPKSTLLKIFTEVNQIFEKEENIIRLKGDSFVVGDLHGHFFDFLNMLELIKIKHKLSDYEINLISETKQDSITNTLEHIHDTTTKLDVNNNSNEQSPVNDNSSGQYTLVNNNITSSHSLVNNNITSSHSLINNNINKQSLVNNNINKQSLVNNNITSSHTLVNNNITSSHTLVNNNITSSHSPGLIPSILNKLDKNIVFLGDYVDRGENSVELLIYLLIMKLIYPNQVILLRGNHENRIQTSVYGFLEECISKYDYFIYWKFCELFELFPVTAMINDKYICLHGGIMPSITLKYINKCDRVQEYSELSGLFWSDPTNEIDYFMESQRGAGFLYGKQALNDFLDEIKCEFLIRSHQLVFDGIEEKFDKKCITVWSAPNYCYKCKNMAAVVSIEDNSHRYVFYKAVEHQRIEGDSIADLRGNYLLKDEGFQ